MMGTRFRITVGFACLALLAAAETPAPQYRISGIVVNAGTGEPVAKVDVALGHAEQADALQNTITGEDGRFHFDGLHRGKYWLEAQGRGFSPQRFEQHEEFATGIAVGPDLQSENIVFRMRPDATVDGTVTDDQGDAIRDGQVMLFRGGTHDGSDSVQIVTTAPPDDQGHYHFGHLGPGTYFLAVSARPWYAEMRPGFRPRLVLEFGPRKPGPEPDPQEQAQFDVAYPLTYYPGTSDPNGATPIVVESGQHASADISLAAVPAVHIRISNAVTDPSQGFGTNVMQKVLGGATMPVPGQTSDFRDGELEVSGIPAGQYTFVMHGGGAGSMDREKPIAVSSDAQIDLADASASPTISGIVRLDTGEPLPQFTAIRLSNHQGAAIGTGIDAKGKFEIEGGQNDLLPGLYEITVASAANLLVKGISASGAKVSGSEIEIGSNPVRMVITVSEAHGRVDGTALRDGKPVAGAMIVLVPPDMEHSSSLVRRDQSDSDGTFSLFNVLPGKYTVVAIENGWSLLWLKHDVMEPYLKHGQPVEVTAGGRSKISVDVRETIAR